MARSGELSDANRVEIIALYQAGLPVSEITARTGAPRSTIYYVLRKGGIEPSRQVAKPLMATTTAVERLIERIEKLEAEVAKLRLALAECEGRMKSMDERVERNTAALGLRALLGDGESH